MQIKSTKLIFAFVAVAAGSVATLALRGQGKAPQGFTIHSMTFDETAKYAKDTPHPKIPASWKFVGVGPEAHNNATTLWFQGEGGVLYAVRVWVDKDTGDYTLEPNIDRLERE
ncbi:MAG TPA: hypothetical protein VN736_29470 [Candidatus Limnocylindrales bacterium]|nr:hypothetical protein [Candidatus Limnocylindrales bacterium]